MQDLRDHTERLAWLVQLLSEMGHLDIYAQISHIDIKPGSDEATLLIRFAGPDTHILTANNGQVLSAIETLAIEMLALSGMDGRMIRFDAGNFLANQERRLRQVARAGVGRVRFTGTPHVFPPMPWRDRRLLEQELLLSGLCYETLGQQSTRWVVLFPMGVAPLFATPSPRCATEG